LLGGYKFNRDEWAIIMGRVEAKDLIGGRKVLYHGSPYVVEHPKFGVGNPANDYGLGFYCAFDVGLAGEWAVHVTGLDGFINQYEFEFNGLSILDLDKLDAKIWISLLLANRRGKFARVVRERISRFVDKFGMDTSDYDVITGWRANDAYFRYVSDFIQGLIPYEGLLEAMKLGNLGELVCVKSEAAFDRLRFTRVAPAAASAFLDLAIQRDLDAREKYAALSESAFVGGAYVYELLEV
jgi:hypothetical protein